MQEVIDEELSDALAQLLEGACLLEDAIDDVTKMDRSEIERLQLRLSDIERILIDSRKRLSIVEFEEEEEEEESASILEDLNIQANCEQRWGRDYS